MANALDGVRVVEFTDEVGAYCGKLLADLGASVVKVEPPGGGGMRHIPPYFHDRAGVDIGLQFWFLNTSKRSIVLDLEDETDRRRALALALSADIVVEDMQPGYLAARDLGYNDLSAQKQSLVYTSITGFGQTGPHAGWTYSDIVGQAMGGVMTLAGEPEDPPNQIAGQQANVSASIHAAQGTMLALLHAEAHGKGQHVDVSAQEALSMSQETAMQTWDMLGRNRVRTGELRLQSTPLPGYCVYEACDGYVYIGVLAPAGAELSVLVDWMDECGMAGDLRDEPYATTIAGLNMRFLTQFMADPSGSSSDVIEQLAHIHEAIAKFILTMSAVEAYEEGQKRNLLFGLVSTPQDLANNPQLRARNWFQPLHPAAAGASVEFPGAPYRLSQTPVALGPPPTLGQHTHEVLAELDALGVIA